MENINILIQKLINEKIHDKIDIDYMCNLFDIIDKNKPIPIEYYKKQLFKIPNIVNKKCDIKTCNRKALYMDEYNINYCWIHSQTNSH
jgi:hypothetical protein